MRDHTRCAGVMIARGSHRQSLDLPRQARALLSGAPRRRRRASRSVSGSCCDTRGLRIALRATTRRRRWSSSASISDGTRKGCQRRGDLRQGSSRSTRSRRPRRSSLTTCASQAIRPRRPARVARRSSRSRRGSPTWRPAGSGRARRRAAAVASIDHHRALAARAFPEVMFVRGRRRWTRWWPSPIARGARRRVCGDAARPTSRGGRWRRGFLARELEHAGPHGVVGGGVEPRSALPMATAPCSS